MCVCVQGVTAGGIDFCCALPTDGTSHARTTSGLGREAGAAAPPPPTVAHGIRTLPSQHHVVYKDWLVPIKDYAVAFSSMNFVLTVSLS